jgi:cytochrome c oxidase subunit 3
LPLPRLLWLNTGVLVASSVALERARRSARSGRLEAVRPALLAGAVAALLFLAGQLLAWRQLAAAGQFLDNSPAAAFFYLLTAVHGLHILGGLVALGRTIVRSGAVPDPDPPRLGVELCALYWHFLLVVWLVLLAVLLLNVGHVHGAMH